MPLAYYDQLSRRDQGIYRASDKVARLELKEPEAVRAIAAVLERALDADDRLQVEQRAQSLADAVCTRFRVPRIKMRVLSVRPSETWGELHGLYERVEGETPVISVWMRTARKSQVVKYRTFLRTILHELCHHLDYDHLKLADSFHTEGFFRRESSLVRQIAGKAGKKNANKPRATVAAPARTAQSDKAAASALARCRELLDK